MKRNGEKQKGSLMIESIVAVSLVVIGLLGIIHFITQSTVTNREVRNKFIATYLAAEGIEVVKNIIDTDITLEGSFWNDTVGTSAFEQMYEVDYLTTKDDFELNLLYSEDSARALGFDPDTGTYGYGGPVETPFKRILTVSADGGGTFVSSKVMWIVHGEDYEVRLEDIFTGWRSEG